MGHPSNTARTAPTAVPTTRRLAVAGGLLEASTLVTASPVSLTSFSIAFTVVGMIAASAAIPFLALPSDAGSSVSGHGAQAAEE